MPALNIDGRVVHFEVAGEGLPVVLLHAFPLSSEAFEPQLRRPPKGVRVIAPDHRGFGRSSVAPGVATMEAMAADALAVLDSLQVSRAVVGGVSMGGYVALALTRFDPSRVLGLALCDTQSAADDAAGKARREETARDVEANGMAGLAQAMLPRLLAPQASQVLKERVNQLMLSANPSGVAAASRGMGARLDAREILARFAGPAVMIVGSLDVITPPEKARAMAELVKGARVEVLEGAGHLSNLEQPEAFTAALERFASAVRDRG